MSDTAVDASVEKTTKVSGLVGLHSVSFVLCVLYGVSGGAVPIVAAPA